MAQPPIRVVDPRLAAGRGEEFSAGFWREETEVQRPEQAFQSDQPGTETNHDGSQMASVHEAIPDSNRGFQMLQRMGWKGQGLGSKENGIVEPVSGGAEAGIRLGLGKQEEDNFYTAADNIQRKRLEVEIQADEDEARAAKREMQAEREQQIKADVTTIKRTFYCEVCHKQYSSAAELEVHLSSYDHHHRKRLVEMRSAEYERTRKDRGRREKKRQEKEMARLNEQIQKARGNQEGSEQAPLPPQNDDAPPLPDAPHPPPDAPPPLPPTTEIPPHPAGGPNPGSAFGSSHQAGLRSARGAVQFNMGKPSDSQKISAGGLLGVRKPPIQKNQLKSKVAAFAIDSDEEGG